MHHKLRIGILFGGQSAEHNISIMSAFNVIKALDQTKYDIVLVGIDRDGKMYLQKLEVEKTIFDHLEKTRLWKSFFFGEPSLIENFWQ